MGTSLKDETQTAQDDVRVWMDGWYVFEHSLTIDHRAFIFTPCVIARTKLLQSTDGLFDQAAYLSVLDTDVADST